MAEWKRHLTPILIMAGAVSSIHTGGNFIFLLKPFKTLDANFIWKCQKSDLCYLGKNSIVVSKLTSTYSLPRTLIRLQSVAMK